MTAPDSSLEARQMAGACVRVEQRGSALAAVVYRAPGTGHVMVYAVSNAKDADRLADELVDLLAPLVDLGMRHAEARRPAPRPLPCDSDPNNADPDD